MACNRKCRDVALGIRFRERRSLGVCIDVCNGPLRLRMQRAASEQDQQLEDPLARKTANSATGHIRSPNCPLKVLAGYRKVGCPQLVWKEFLLAALLTNNTVEAEKTARARIAAHDVGSFSSGGKSFYERALALCEMTPNDSFNADASGAA